MAKTMGISRCDIERVHHSNMSTKRFSREYEGVKPVIIEGLIDEKWPARATGRWSRPGLLSTFSDAAVHVRTVDHGVRCVDDRYKIRRSWRKIAHTNPELSIKVHVGTVDDGIRYIAHTHPGVSIIMHVGHRKSWHKIAHTRPGLPDNESTQPF